MTAVQLGGVTSSNRPIARDVACGTSISRSVMRASNNSFRRSTVVLDAGRGNEKRGIRNFCHRWGTDEHRLIRIVGECLLSSVLIGVHRWQFSYRGREASSSPTAFISGFRV